jgi:imidazolonepropionase-like amidohydrolase
MTLTLLITLAGTIGGTPVADSSHFVVWNHGRPAGEMRVVRDADSVAVAFHYVDRNRGPRVYSRYRVGSGGTLVGIETRALLPDGRTGNVNEWFELRGDSASWRAGSDSSRIRAETGTFYRLRGTTPFDAALLAEFLLRQKERTARLLPVGMARLTIAAETTVVVGGRSQRVRLAMIDGLGLSTQSVWLDERGQFFASDAGWFVTVPRGAEQVIPVLRSVELAERGRRSADVVRRLTKPAAGPIVIRNADVFDSERGVVRPRTTIVIERDRITAVGPADSVREPPRATVIDASGKTVIPGLWDMHTHLFQTSEENGVLHLAAGITTVRDVASDIDAAISHRQRADAGTLLFPRLILAGFIEGPGAWAGPSEVLVRTEAEARAWVARYDSLGYEQIKLYNLVHPDLVPSIADEAHKRGMRLSGHVPRGLSVEAAVQLGFDEIQHAAFLFSTFFQDSLYVPRMRPYSGIAALVAPSFDVDDPRMKTLIAFLKERGTVIDGTFNIWLDRSQPLADGTDVVFGPTRTWMPEIMRRGESATPPRRDESTPAQRASANYMRLIKRLFDAGVPLVPGTDNTPGLSLVGELEIYERAGIPAPQVLQIATIGSARVMKDDKDYGSVAVGKVADLVIVNGKPATTVRDLRKSETVIRAGRVYSTRELYATVGISPK